MTLEIQQGIKSKEIYGNSAIVVNYSQNTIGLFTKYFYDKSYSPLMQNNIAVESSPTSPIWIVFTVDVSSAK